MSYSLLTFYSGVQLVVGKALSASLDSNRLPSDLFCFFAEVEGLQKWNDYWDGN